MKIELNYTHDELVTLLDGLNNALISLGRNYSALTLGVEDGIPINLLQLNLSEDDYKHRFYAVKDLYEHLLTYEHS